MFDLVGSGKQSTILSSVNPVPLFDVLAEVKFDLTYCLIVLGWSYETNYCLDCLE